MEAQKFPDKIMRYAVCHTNWGLRGEEGIPKLNKFKSGLKRLIWT